MFERLDYLFSSQIKKNEELRIEIKARNLTKTLALLKAGADPNHTFTLKGGSNYSFLHTVVIDPPDANFFEWYSMDNHVGFFDKFVEDYVMVETLLERGACVNFNSLLFNTPLYQAVQSNNLNIAKVLLNNGADPNISFGITTPPCLHLAIKNKFVSMISLLLDNGADPYKRHCIKIDHKRNSMYVGNCFEIAQSDETVIGRAILELLNKWKKIHS